MSGLAHLDVLVRTWIVLHRLPLLDGVMSGATAIGRGGMVWIAIAAFLTLARRLPLRALVQLVLAILITSAITNTVLKPTFGRERPFLSTPDVAVIGDRLPNPSFPSGHTANAAAGAFVLSSFVPAAAPLWWMLAAVIGYSRVYLGVHYPSDVLGGALVGLACAAAVMAAWRRFSRAKPARFLGNS